jgi:hypothetical protein
MCIHIQDEDQLNGEGGRPSVRMSEVLAGKVELLMARKVRTGMPVARGQERCGKKNRTYAHL